MSKISKKKCKEKCSLFQKDHLGIKTLLLVLFELKKKRQNGRKRQNSQLCLLWPTLMLQPEAR
jgi:hypothetical protein